MFQRQVRKVKNESEILATWMAERDKAIKTLDVEKFRAFYREWMDRGIYQWPLPRDDKIIEISLRKMLYNLQSATEEEKAEAERWLTEHGCDTTF